MRACSAAILLLLSALVSAEETNSGSETELTTVSTYGQSNQELTPFDIPGSHSRIDLTSDTIGDVQLENILEQQAGIQVRHLGGRGQFSYPSIRGASGKQLQIVWDGIPLTSLNNSEGELPSIGLSALGSIDIYRGIAPVELAPASIGGTIHLRSKTDFKESSSGSAYASTGSFGYYSAGLWQQYHNESWRFFAAFDWMQADNDFDTRTDINSVNNPNQSVTEKRLNNGSEHNLVLIRADYIGNSSVQPTVIYQHQNKRRELPGKRNIPQNNAHFDTEDNRVSIKLNIPYSGQQQIALIGTVYQLEEYYDDQGDKIGLGRQKDTYQTDGTELRVNHHLSLQLLENLLTASVRRENTTSDFALMSEEKKESNCLASSGCPYDYERRQYQLGDRITGSVGDIIRLSSQINLVKFEDIQKNHYGIADQHSDDQFITGDAGLNWQLNKSGQVELLVSRQVRAVSTQELFGDRGMTEGNPDLESETSKGLDLVYRLNTDNAEYSLSAYQRLRENAIVASADSRGVIKYENTARTRHRGIEFNIAIDLTRNFTLRGNSGWHNHVITENRRDFFLNKRVPNQRTWDNYYSLIYTHNHIGTSLSWLFQSGGFYETSNRLPINDTNQFNWNIYYQINQLKVQFDAFNLTDNKVSDFSDYPVPGRNYSIKLNYSW